MIEGLRQPGQRWRRPGSGPARRAPRRPGRPQVQRRRPPCSPGRGAALAAFVPAPAVPARPSRGRRPSAGRLGRHQVVDVDRRPASRQPRAWLACPPRSSATMRPSQPPERLARALAELPRPIADRPASGSARAHRLAGSAAAAAAARSTAASMRRRGHRLALEGQTRLPDLVAQGARGCDPPRPAPRGRPRRARGGRGGAPPRRCAARRWRGARRPGPGRATRSTSPSVALIAASVASNDRCARSGATGHRRRSPPAGRGARRWRTPGCRPAGRWSAGRSGSASRGRTRPRRSARPAVVWA